MTTGPYATGREALEAVRHAYEREDTPWADAGSLLLEEACTASGVTLGAYDKTILEWLSRYEPATVAVIRGLILRAFEAGKQQRGESGNAD